MSFVDGAKTAAGLACALVDDVVTAHRDTVDRQRSALEEWQADHGIDAYSGDAERLRAAVRRYRNSLDGPAEADARAAITEMIDRTGGPNEWKDLT